MAAVITGGYRASPQETYLPCNTGAGVVGITLPGITTVADGHSVTVVDIGANAAANNISLNTADGVAINGLSVFTIANNGASCVFTKNGQTWAASASFETAGGNASLQNLWTVQTVTTTTATINPQTTLALVNFAGTVALTLPATNNSNVVLGRPLFIQNVTNTGNTSSQAIWLVSGNANTSINAGANTLTISTAFGGLRLVPSTTGWWNF